MHHHKRRPVKPHPRGITAFDRMRRLAWPVLVLLSVLVVGIGVRTVSKGNLVYYNHKGLPVYAPFAILMGFGFLYVVLLLRRRTGRFK